MQKNNEISYFHFNRSFYNYQCTIAWMINPNNSKQILLGFAWKHPKDDFVKKKGNQLATERLLNLLEKIDNNTCKDSDIDNEHCAILDFDKVVEYICGYKDTKHTVRRYRIRSLRYDLLFEDFKNVLDFHYIAKEVIFCLMEDKFVRREGFTDMTDDGRDYDW